MTFPDAMAFNYTGIATDSDSWHVQVLLMRLRQVCIHPQLALVLGGGAAGVPGAEAGNINGPDPLAGEPFV